MLAESAVCNLQPGPDPVSYTHLDVYKRQANHFYRERVDQHLRIGMRALELLREQGVDQLHSRKLRSFAEVAFQ